jgi:glycosyltransferase involved in cell wall biosynthesis
MASQTTAVSSVISDRYVEVRAVPSGRIITVPNGIDMADETVVTAARLAAREAVGGAAGFVWICVGRLVPEKGQSMLVEALAQVRKGHPEARLAIVGDGPERPRVERVVASLGLGGAVYVLGQRDDVAALLAVADAFVMASRWEGLPMVLLEAAAQGLPIVATDVGGNRDIARPELGAILCEPTVLSLSQSMTSMLESEPDARARIGRALRANVQEKFDLDRVVDQWERIYATAIQGSGH